MRIRKSRLDDYAELARLHRGTIRTINKKDYSPKEIAVWSKRARAERYRSSHAIAVRYVAVEEGKIFGFCDLKKDEPEKFWGLYVHKDHLGKGIGSALIKKMGAKKFVLTATKTARSFYEKHDFKFIKKIKYPIENIRLEVCLMEKKF